MKRNLKTLSSEEFDLVVVGAGIYGVATAWDATLRGLKVALIEKGDFGSATSANSLKTIHGGLRYLQNLDIKRMRESIRERRILMKIAPHLVYPLQVLMPTYANKLKSRPAMFAALIANDVVGFDRNQLEDPHKYMPNGRIISIDEVRKFIPGYTKYNMSGGALWYDCQCYNTERLCLSFILSSVKKGATAANYVKAFGLLKKGNQVVGLQAQDELTGEKFEIKSKMIVNNSGPWVDRIIRETSSGEKFPLSSAMNLVINRKILNNSAAGLSGPYKYVHPNGTEYKSFRILFFSPWRDYTIIGTNHLPYHGDPDRYKVTEAEIQDFLSVVNSAYAAAEIKREDVSYFYGGFLPLAGISPTSGEVQLQRHYKIYDHSLTDNIDGILSVVGVKYTTARDVGEKTVDLVFKKMGKRSGKCLTDEVTLYGGNIGHFENFVDDAMLHKPEALTENQIKHLSYNYGSTYHQILDYGKTDAQWLEALPESDEVIKAEILHGVREEMALKLADVIQRRTDLGSGKHPGKACVAAVAEIMASELSWDNARKAQEIKETNQIYVPA
jgi:glycerol-3-phosphate dehydrogenase